MFRLSGTATSRLNIVPAGLLCELPPELCRHQARRLRRLPVDRHRHQRDLRPGHRRRRAVGAGGRVLLAQGAAQPARARPRQPRRLRRPRQAQRVRLRRPHVSGLRRHDERRHAVSLQLHGQAAARRPRVSTCRATPSSRTATLFEKFSSAPGRSSTRSTSARTVSCAGTGRPSWDRVLRQGAAQRRGAARSHPAATARTPTTWHGKTLEQKLALLARISYQEFLLTHAKMSPDALPFFLGQGGRNNKRVDTTPALEAARAGRIGFDGLGLPDEESFRQGSFTFHFPDGNASIARLLVRGSCPRRFPGTHDMASIVKAPPVAYDQPRRRGDADARPPEQHGHPRRGRRPGRPADRREGRVPARRQDAPGAGRKRGARLLQRADSAAAARTARRAEGGARLLGEGADALHQRAAAALDVVQAAGRGQHQRAGDVPPEHEPRPGLHRRRLPGRDHARRTDRGPHGAQPEQAGAAAQGTESPRPAGTADDDVPRFRARRSAGSSPACSPAPTSTRPQTSSASP